MSSFSFILLFFVLCARMSEAACGDSTTGGTNTYTCDGVDLAVTTQTPRCFFSSLSGQSASTSATSSYSMQGSCFLGSCDKYTVTFGTVSGTESAGSCTSFSSSGVSSACGGSSACSAAFGPNALSANQRAAVMIACNNPGGTACSFTTASQVQTIWTSVTTAASTTTTTITATTSGSTSSTASTASTGTTTSSLTTTPSSSIVATVQGFTDNNCGTPNSAASSTVTVASSGTCGTIFGLQGLVVISGNTATLRSCTCATSTTCGSNIGSAITITNGACTLASVLGLTGSFKVTWTSSTSSSSASCFHKDTVITYDKISYTLDQLRVHPECSIPHVVEAVGVVVTASCSSIGQKTLRLTAGHLVYTQRGLQAAADLKPGKHVVYADLEEKNPCLVSSVTKEVEAHEYFGLNCLNSQVLASGLKASTFEKIHSVPAFWMHVVGRILGIKRASAIGDYVADMVQKMNLI